MISWQTVEIVAWCLFPNVGPWINGYLCAKELKSNDGQPTWFDKLVKPDFVCPLWVVGPVWLILFTSMGFAGYLVHRDGGGFNGIALIPLLLFFTQLLLNWLWMPLFFLTHRLLLSFIELSLVAVLVLACVIIFHQVNVIASYIMIPYIIWLLYADLLNYCYWKYNPECKGEVQNKTESPHFVYA